MNMSEILSTVDHTLLRTDASLDEIKQICDDGIKYGTASVCIPPSYVKDAAEYAAGRVPICTVIGFPNGYSTIASKCFEAEDAVQNGAAEIDMVINIGWVKDKRYTDVLTEINSVKASCCGRLLKVIIECCLLTDEEKIEMCNVVSASDADFIKTSTGFSTGGATFDDIALMAKHMDVGKRIKAAGGIKTIEDAQRFLSLGAHRLGTSRIVKIVKESEK